jgi:hypothetical protein
MNSLLTQTGLSISKTLNMRRHVVEGRGATVASRRR